MPVKTNEREYRDMRMAAAERAEGAEEMRVEGYATTFNDPYVLYSSDWITYREVVLPEAFENADLSDVIMQYDHQGRVFARISNGTLECGVDDHGLKIDAELSGTQLGRSLYEEIAGGYTTKMSYAFIVSDEEEERTESEGGHVDYLRKIKGVSKVFDVSAVSLPANDATEISVRSLTDGAISRERAERLAREELELERRRAEVRARAIRERG